MERVIVLFDDQGEHGVSYLQEATARVDSGIVWWVFTSLESTYNFIQQYSLEDLLTLGVIGFFVDGNFGLEKDGTEDGELVIDWLQKYDQVIPIIGHSKERAELSRSLMNTRKRGDKVIEAISLCAAVSGTIQYSHAMRE